MTVYERGQWLLMLHAYLMGLRDQAPNDFADQYALALINELLWQAYQDAAIQQGSDVGSHADLGRWLLTLWPAPPMA